MALAVSAQRTGTSQQTNDKVVQFIADNVDHDIGTLDGHATFTEWVSSQQLLVVLQTLNGFAVRQ